MGCSSCGKDNYLVFHDGFELVGISNHALDFGNDGYAADELFLLVDGGHFGLQIVGLAVAELFDGVDTGSFEQFGKLTRNPFNAHQVGVVGPFED